MSSTGPTRLELVRAIIAQGRTNSTGTVILHAAVAERLGLNPSDHKCADLMMSQSETCTPGRLAELTGLSTGAITGVIDRLERAGFLIREHDPEDRRRVLLRVTQTRGPEMHALFQPLSRGVEALLENYTIAELAVVLRYMREIHLVTEDIAQKLRSGTVTVGDARASRSRGDGVAAVPQHVPLDVPSDRASAGTRATGAKRKGRAAAREAAEKGERKRAVRKGAWIRGTEAEQAKPRGK
jgi:DNA-binding MarR family transcriptional regulator